MMAMANEHVILVTGAAGGIGNEIVRILLGDLDAAVVATDVVAGQLQDLKDKYPERLEIRLGDIVDVSNIL